MDYSASGYRVQNTILATAGGDILRGEPVVISGTTVVVATAATDKIVGIALHGAAEDDTVEIAQGGQVTALVVGAVTYGATIGLDASGDLAAVTAPADGDTLVGRCLKADTETDPKLVPIQLGIQTAFDAAGA